MESKNQVNVFVVEDDSTSMEMICDMIRTKFPQLTIFKFNNGEDAIKNMNLQPKIVVLDYYLDKLKKDAKNGLDVLTELREMDPEIKVIMISAQEHLDIAVNIIKYGAYDYIVKSETAMYRLENILNHLTGHLIIDRKVFINKFLMVMVAALLVALILTFAFLL